MKISEIVMGVWCLILLVPSLILAQASERANLIEGAKKEGKLVWYTSMAIDTSKPLLDAFFRYYMRHCVYGEDESACSRIACVGWKPGK